MSVDSKVIDKLEEVLKLLKKEEPKKEKVSDEPKKDCKCEDCKCKESDKEDTKCPLDEESKEKVAEMVKECPAFSEGKCPFSEGCPFKRVEKFETEFECEKDPTNCLIGILMWAVLLFIFIYSLIRMLRF